MSDADATGVAIPPCLATPCGVGEHPPADIGKRLMEGLHGVAEITVELARACSDWVAVDFEDGCMTLLTGDGTSDREPAGGGEGWLELRRLRGVNGGERVAHLARWDGAGLLLHAALVGLARGASREAFAHAAVRKINGRPLIQCELIAARLSAIAANEVIGELQLGYLCELSEAQAEEVERDLARREIRRASLAAVVESAHVHGGHGFVQCQAPGKRVELAYAVLARLATPEDRALSIGPQSALR